MTQPSVVDRFPALLFDLDGTLIDSAGEITQALNLLLEELDRPPVTLEQVRSFVGDGATKLVERALEVTGDRLPSGARALSIPRYLELYKSIPADPGQIYPGVRETLEALTAAGHRLAICTNKPEALSLKILDEIGLASLFGTVVGGDTLASRKPSGDPLLHALRLLGLEGAGAIMIGDNRNDVLAARAAGVPVIAVSYGYPRMPVEELGADRIIDRFADVPGALAELAGGES